MQSKSSRLGIALVTLVACAAASVWLARGLPVDSSLAPLLESRSDPDRSFARFEESFGGDDALLVVVHAAPGADVFAEPALQLVAELSDRLGEHTGFSTVASLTTLPDFSVASAPLLGLHPTLPRPLLSPFAPPDAPTAAQLRQNPLLANGILAGDARATALWAVLEPASRHDPAAGRELLALADELRAMGEDAAPLRVSVTGPALLHAEVQRSAARDAGLLSLAALAVVAGVARLAGVSSRALLASAWAVAVLVAALCAWMRLRGFSVHVLTPAVLPLLIATTAATTIHGGLALRWYPSRAAATGRACGASAMTTALGFATLILSPLRLLRELGELLALGAILAMAITWSALHWLARGSSTEEATNHGFIRSARAPSGPRPVSPLRPLRALEWMPIVAFSALPWFLLWPERATTMPSLESLLPADQAATVDAGRAAAAFGPATPLQVVVRLPPADPPALLDVETHRELDALVHHLEEVAGERISATLGTPTLLEYLNSKLPDSEGRAEFTPAAAEFANRWLWPLLLSTSPDDSPAGTILRGLAEPFRHLIAADGCTLRIGCRTPLQEPREILRLVDELHDALRPVAHSSLGATLEVTGSAVVVARTARDVRRTQLRSLGVGLLALGLTLAVIVRRRRDWSWAILVNTATLIGVANMACAARLSLDLFSTVLTAAVLGTLVDDTLHLLLAIRRRRAIRTGGSDAQAVAEAVAEVGPALHRASVALAAGFAVFLLAQTATFRPFAICATTAVALAWWWDCRVLPRLLSRARRPSQIR